LATFAGIAFDMGMPGGRTHQHICDGRGEYVQNWTSDKTYRPAARFCRELFRPRAVNELFYTDRHQTMGAFSEWPGPSCRHRPAEERALRARRGAPKDQRTRVDQGRGVLRCTVLLH
jgi:hypothetical protein